MTQVPDQLPIQGNPVLSLRGLGKVIDDRVVLRDVNLSINCGEFIAVLGANGAGKSTLLKILATLIPATDGDFLLFGKPVRSSSAAMRRRIGLIDHQPLLYRDLTAIENLEFFAALYGVSDPSARACHMLERFGLSSRRDDPVKSFSRGMVQRVAIARALLHEPDLLLADEPFAGLDAPSAEFLERFFRDLALSGKTIVLVNHDVEQSLRLVDRIVVLRDGTVAVDQPAQRLYAQEVLEEVRAS
jgi:heme exporter protein A